MEISDTRQTEAAGAGCAVVGGDEIHCPIDGVTTVIVNLGDLDDQLSVFGSNLNFTVNGGDGDDIVSSGGGNDILNGDAGDDVLQGRAGADAINGGTGLEDEGGDTNGADYADSDAHTVTVGAGANDGDNDIDPSPAVVSEGDNVGADMEVIRTGGGVDSLTGGANPVTLHGWRRRMTR